MASDVLYSWSRRISRPSSAAAAAAALLRAALVVIVVAALVAVDVVRNTDDARSEWVRRLVKIKRRAS